MPDTPLNPDALEAAAKAMVTHSETWDEERSHWSKEFFRGKAKLAVSAYLAVALPEVTNVEELDALPDMSAVLDGDGFVLQKLPDDDDDSYWFIVGDTSSYYDRDIELPARVLYRPEVNDA